MLGGGTGDARGNLPWELVLEVIAAVASVEFPDAYAQRAMAALSVAVPFDLGSYNEVDSTAGRAFFSEYPPSPPPDDADLDAFPHLIRQNPILQYQEATGDGSAHRLSDFLTADELHALDLYRRVYQPLGPEFQVAFCLAVKRPLVIAIALNRRARDFTDGELAVLDVLRPHLIQAYRNVQALAALRGIDGALAEVGKAVVVIGDEGVEIHAPSWAEAELAKHFGPVTASGLPQAVMDWVSQERRGVLADGRPRINRPLTSVLDGRQLVVRFVPGAGTRADVLVIEERAPERDRAELQRLGLTPREAEILTFAIHGETTVGISRRLHIAPGTLSKHLQHIYRKLGVMSRSAAVAAASDAIYSAR